MINPFDFCEEHQMEYLKDIGCIFCYHDEQGED